MFKGSNYTEMIQYIESLNVYSPPTHPTAFFAPSWRRGGGMRGRRPAGGDWSDGPTLGGRGLGPPGELCPRIHRAIAY